MLATANQLFNARIRRDAEHRTEFTPEYPHFDSRTRELFDQAAEDNHAWFDAEGDGFVLDVPMTKANAARCLHQLMEDASGPDGRETVEVIDYLDTLEVQEERVKLVFKPGEGGSFHFMAHEEELSYRPEIREELEVAGHPLEAVPDIAEIRALLGGS